MQNLSLCIGENNPDDGITSDKLGALTIRHHKLKNVTGALRVVVLTQKIIVENVKVTKVIC